MITYENNLIERDEKNNDENLKQIYSLHEQNDLNDIQSEYKLSQNCLNKLNLKDRKKLNIKKAMKDGLIFIQRDQTADLNILPVSTSI